MLDARDILSYQHATRHSLWIRNLVAKRPFLKHDCEAGGLFIVQTAGVVYRLVLNNLWAMRIGKPTLWSSNGNHLPVLQVNPSLALSLRSIMKPFRRER